MDKPTYLIIYKTENWKVDFFKNRLIQYATDLTTQIAEKYIFKYFDVHFLHIDDLIKTKPRGIRAFGIVIEENEKINEKIIDEMLLPYIKNPFIGGIHIMR